MSSHYMASRGGYAPIDYVYKAQNIWLTAYTRLRIHRQLHI
jgi:hypothetical protein